MLEVVDACIKVVSICVIFVCLILSGQLLFWRNVKLLTLDSSKVANKKGLCDWVGLCLLAIPVVTYFYPKIYKVDVSKLALWITGWVILVATIIVVTLKGARRYMQK